MKTLVVPGARFLGAPRGWDQQLDGSCGQLAVVDSIDVQSGQNFMYSFYRPSPDDMEALNNGGIIRLGIMGTTHPVINMCVMGPKITGVIDPSFGFDMGPVIEEE